MSVALIEPFDRWFLSLSKGAQKPLVEMTATLNVVVSINSTTVMQIYWSAPSSKLASASPTLCLANGAARAKGGRTLRHSRPSLHIIILLDVF